MTIDMDIKKPGVSPPEKVTIRNCKEIKGNNGWDLLGLCPNHDDHHESLAINRTQKRFKCLVPTCGFAGVLWDEEKAHPKKQNLKKEKKVRESPNNHDIAYTYYDIDGLTPLHRTCKIIKNKKFWQECYCSITKKWWIGLTLPDEKAAKLVPYNAKYTGLSLPKGKPIKLVLYNLKRIIDHHDKKIFILEGEKACDRFWNDLGLIVTTSPMGAGNWNPIFNKYLKKRKVVAIPDNDDPGEKHVIKIADSNMGNCKSFKIVHLLGLSEKEDSDDWLDKIEDIEIEGRKLTREEILQELKSYIDSEEEYVPTEHEPPTIIHEVSQEKLNNLLEKAIPEGGFIRQYIDTFSDITDCPKSFLFWGAITLVSTILGKDTYVNWEARKLYPNIWCVFLAPSGFRKGTGIDFVVKILRALDPGLLLPTMASEEGLTKVLDISKTGGSETGLIRWQEFARVLSSWEYKQKSWKASKEFFIDIYDGKAFKKRLSKDEFNIGETAVSFLGACIPDSFNKHFSVFDMDSGFFGRVFLINVKEKDKYLAIPPTISETEFNRLIVAASGIKNNYEEQEISYSVIEEDFTNWANKTFKEKEAGFLDAFYSRIETHAMKLAMIYNASRDRKNVISKEDFQYAINAINFLIESSRIMVSETIGLNEEQRLIKSIEEYIRKKKKVYKADVSKKFNLQWRSLTEIEKTLKERDLIEIVEESVEYKRGRRRKMYVAI